MRKIFFLFIILSAFLNSFSQTTFARIDTLPHYKDGDRFYGDTLSADWKYAKGDNLQWASPTFDDASWKLFPTRIPLDSVPENSFETIGWFRIWVEIDSSLIDKTIAFMVGHPGASEIYIDGNLAASFGEINAKDPSKEKRYSPVFIPTPVRFEKTTKHLIAVRYANAAAVQNFKEGLSDDVGFTLKVGDINESILFSFIDSNTTTTIFIFYFTFFFALSLLHLAFFFFYRVNRSNLYYSIFLGAFGTTFLMLVVNRDVMFPDLVFLLERFTRYFGNLFGPAIIATLYSIFYKRLPKIFWLWLGLFALDAICTFFRTEVPFLSGILDLIVIEELLRMVIASIIKKRDGAWTIGIGVISTLLFFVGFFVLIATGNLNIGTGWHAMWFGIAAFWGTLSIPLCMTIYLAREFAKTSKNLEKKLVEVEELSAKTLEQEKEKQKILETQKDVLESQVVERTKEITEQKKVIEEKNKDITDSITYAKRIQEAMLPPLSFIDQILPETFVLYKPKDIVAGDFYWAEQITLRPIHKNESEGRNIGGGQTMTVSSSFREEVNVDQEKDSQKIILIAAADCTGHGVPGAMVSVVCSNALNRSVNEFGLIDPGKILDKTRELVLDTFAKSDKAVKDGMDVSLCSILYEKNSSKIKVSWAGANNPLWYIEGGQNKEITAHKQSIGKNENPLPFPTHHLELNKGDTLFLFTDGYADQFGGEKGKKFKYKQLLDLISSSNNLPLPEIKDILSEAFEKWKGALEQIDDVCIIGIRL